MHWNFAYFAHVSEGQKSVGINERNEPSGWKRLIQASISFLFIAAQCESMHAYTLCCKDEINKFLNKDGVTFQAKFHWQFDEIDWFHFISLPMVIAQFSSERRLENRFIFIFHSIKELSTWAWAKKINRKEARQVEARKRQWRKNNNFLFLLYSTVICAIRRSLWCDFLLDLSLLLELTFNYKSNLSMSDLICNIIWFLLFISSTSPVLSRPCLLARFTSVQRNINNNKQIQSVARVRK